MEKKNAISEKILETLRKYPELDEVVDTYLKAADTQQKMHLSADAREALETEGKVKPLEGLFHASVGKDGTVPEEIMQAFKKYPAFEESVNAYLATMRDEQEKRLSIDAVKSMESQAGVKAAKVDFSKAIPKEIMDVIREYPDIEKEIDGFLDTMKKEQELHLSVDAVKMLEK